MTFVKFKSTVVTVVAGMLAAAAPAIAHHSFAMFDFEHGYDPGDRKGIPMDQSARGAARYEVRQTGGR